MFNPSSAGQGDHLITYTYADGNGCIASESITITVHALPAVSLAQAGPYCIDGSPVQLNGIPSGGVYSGDGVNATGLFTPSLAGVGGHIITYSYTDANSCMNTASINITVNALPVVTLPSVGPFCLDAPAVQLAGSPSGGTYSGAGVTSTGLFTSSAAGSGSHQISYSYTDGNGCNVTASTTIIVNPLPVPSLTSSDPDNIMCAGTTVSFTAGGGIDYDFRLSGISVQSGSSDIYTTNSLINGQIIDVKVTDNNGCMATSYGITNIINPTPFIFVTNPATCSADLASYSLTVAASAGIVASTAGIVTNTGTNVWTITNVPSGTDIILTVTDNNGCSGVVPVIAPDCSCSVIPAPVSGGNQSYCASDSIPELSVSVPDGETADWYDSASGGSLLLSASLSFSPPEAGTYYAMARNAISNCVSSTRTPVTLTMNPLPNAILLSSDTDNTFCTGTSVIFTADGGINYNFVIGNASVQNGNLNTFTTSQLQNGQGIHVTVTNADGCSANSEEIINTVNQYPVANAGTGGSSCSFSFILNAIPTIGTGTWQEESGPGTAAFSPNANSPTAIVTVSDYGTYIFRWIEVSNTCSDTSEVAVNFFEQPVAKAGPGGNNCGLQYYLEAVPSVGSGIWTKTSGPGTAAFNPSANDPHAMVVVSGFGQYTFTWTEVNGNCFDSSPVTVNFIKELAADAGPDGSVCDNNYDLAATPGQAGSSGFWTKLSGPGNAEFIPDSGHPDAKVTVDKFGIYIFSWTEINSTCQSVDNVTVTFRPLPVVSAGRDTIICENQPVRLHGTGTGTFSWMPDSLLDDAHIAEPLASPDSTTLFNLTLTDQFGCKNSDEMQVFVRKNPVADAGKDQVLNYLLSTTLSAVDPGEDEKGVWSLLSGTGTIGDTAKSGTSVTGLSIGENIFIWTVSNGVCKPSGDSVVISVLDLVIPTLITPNGDGRNDYFVLKGLETLGRAELIIFDRRGARVYRNPDYDNLWNGVDYNGNPLPDDTYFYTLKAENGKSMSGYIVIRH